MIRLALGAKWGNWDGKFPKELSNSLWAVEKGRHPIRELRATPPKPEAHTLRKCLLVLSCSVLYCNSSNKFMRSKINLRFHQKLIQVHNCIGHYGKDSQVSVFFSNKLAYRLFILFEESLCFDI